MIHEAQAREILDYVGTERTRQDAKWGEQNHPPRDWISILAEEFGEAAMGANKLTFGGDSDERIFDYCLELIETAAVAVAAVESLRRNLTPEQNFKLGLDLITWNDKIEDAWEAKHPT